MSLHALSTRRGRRSAFFGFVVAVLCLSTIGAMILGTGTAFAQTPPAAVTLNQITPEDTFIVLDTGIPVDVGNRYEIATIVPGPLHGTAAEELPRVGTYKIRYTPGANRTEAVQFEYQLCTIASPVLCGTKATATVTITAVNDGPQAGTDNLVINQEQSTLINVLGNDNGGPNEPGDFAVLVAGSVSAPVPSGTAVLEGNQIRFTPATGFCNVNPVTFTYRIQDTSGLQTVGTVNVTVRCPGQPILKLGNPYNFNNHTFKVDVILDSPDVNVAALDFVLSYTCLTDPDTPTDAKLADDVTTTLPASNFLFQVQDQTPPTPGALRFVAASITNPASILAGPSATTRTVATITFKVVSFCASVNLTFGVTDFTGTNGASIPGGGSTVNSSNIPVTSANNAPTNIALDDNKARENTPGAFVGKLSTTDLDVGDTHTYAINPANANFAINFGNELYVNAALAAGSYNLTIQSTDNYGGSVTKNFVIEITNVNQPPIAVLDTIAVRGRTSNINLLGNDADPDDTNPADGQCTGCSIQSVTNGGKGTVTNQGLSVTYLPTDPKATSDTFTYMLTDNDPSGALTAQGQVNVTLLRDLNSNSQEVQFGDCNKDAKVNAGDLTATGLEIFDGDGTNWYNADQGSFSFSPYGCDSNIDPLIDAGDISCTAQKIFAPAFVCGTTLRASNANTATLAVGSALQAKAGTTVQVPVLLNTAGYPAAAVAFALDFNPDELSFDATDADQDGVADAVTLNMPSGLLGMAQYNAAESRVEIIITGLIPPFPLLANGTVATIALTVKEDISVTETALTLTNGSLGSDDGQSLPVEMTAGALQIIRQPALQQVLLPLIKQ